MSKPATRSKKPTPVTTESRGAASKRAKSGNAVQVRVMGSAAYPPYKPFTVAEKATVRTKTLRLQPSYEQGLAILKRVLKIPINKMVNEAVGEYIRRKSAEVESELTTTLEQLQAYRLADPEFLAARQAFIEGEALHGKDDPMEGRIVRIPAPAPVVARYASKAASGDTPGAGPALTRVRELLRS